MSTSKKFKVLCLQTKEYYRDIFADDDEVTLFDDGKEAEAVAQKLSEFTGNKWQVRRHIVDLRWLEREQKRFYDGTYHPVPWDSADWYRSSKYWNLHFAHISVEKDTRIAFTANQDDGLADKQTRIKPGRYLEQFFNRVLDSDEIREWAAYFSVLHENIVVKFAKTADEMQDVYCNGPRSCMDGRHYKNGTFQVPIHPVRVYEGPDLAVAYLERAEDDVRGFICDTCDRTEQGCAYPDRPDGNCGRNRRRDGKYSARCVVWPERKLYGKIYGDTDRLRLSLQREGFKAGSLMGARLQRIPHKFNGTKGFVVPYIDDVRRVKDAGDHLVLDTNGPMESSQYGFAQDNTVNCGACDRRLNPGSDRLYSIRNRNYDREVICTDCYTGRRVMRSTYSGEYGMAEDMINLGDNRIFHIHEDEIDGAIAVCSKTNVWLWRSGGQSEIRHLPDGSAISATWAAEQQCKNCSCGYSVLPGQTEFECTNAQYNAGCYMQKHWYASGVTVHSKKRTPAPEGTVLLTHAEAVQIAAVNRADQQLWENLCYSLRNAEYKEMQEEQARQNRMAAQRARRARERAMQALERESAQ